MEVALEVQNQRCIIMYIHKIQYSYQFFSQKKHQFFIELVMRLRHKKPLNPYKGQTNNDKNEFNDDDFKQQGSPHKKAVNGTTDQISKYAKILTKFIKTINQEYKEYEHQNGRQCPPLIDLNSNQGPADLQENTTLNVCWKGQQIKQQKQFTKLQIKKEVKDDNREVKSLSKKKQQVTTPPPSKQSRNKPSENLFSNTIDQPKSSISAKTSSQALIKIDKQMKQQKINLNSQNSANTGSSFNTNTNFNSQNHKIADNMVGGMVMNSELQNFLNMAPYMMNQNRMMNLDLFQNLTPAQMSQLMRVSPYDMMPGYMPMNMNLMFGMNPLSQMILQQQQQQVTPPKQYQNIFTEQVKVYQNKQLNGNNNNKNQITSLKRSGIHVQIAYDIYLHQLAKSGKTFQKIEQIDPIRNARRIKNSQNQNSKGKESLKKKK